MRQERTREERFPRVETIVRTGPDTGEIVHSSPFDLWGGRESLVDHANGLLQAAKEKERPDSEPIQPVSSGESPRRELSEVDAATAILEWAKVKPLETPALAEDIARWAKLNDVGLTTARSIGSCLAKNQRVRKLFDKRGDHPVTWILKSKPEEES